MDILFRVLDGSYRSRGPRRDLDGYIKTQVHGGVSLETDVETVVDPSFRGHRRRAGLTGGCRSLPLHLAWHRGSELHVDDVPPDFRGPAMPSLPRKGARGDGIVDAHAIGVRVVRVYFEARRSWETHPSPSSNS